MATPSAEPVCKAVLLRPEASPASCSATPASAATVAVTKARPIPRPTRAARRRCPGSSCRVETCVSTSDPAGDRAGRGPERERGRPHRDVDEEDPPPAGAVDERAADQPRGGGADTAQCAPDPQRLVPLGALSKARGE